MPTSKIPIGYGYVDYMEEENEGRNLLVMGWMIHLDGPFDQLQVRLTEDRTLPVEAVERPDLAAAFKHLSYAINAGFCFRIPLAELTEGQILEFTLIGMCEDRAAAKMDISYHRPPTPQVFPPEKLMIRVTSVGSDFFFKASGIKLCNDLARHLRSFVDFNEVKTFLDWGCGPGRLTKHIIDLLPHTHVYGTDIDKEAVEWAGNNLKGRFQSCKQDPPLDYPDDLFNMVIAISVFTHLTQRHQRLWLEEMQRIIKPGGILVATTHGPFAGRWVFPRVGEFDKVFKKGFFDGLADDAMGEIASSGYYRTTFQDYTYTRKAWGRYFEIIDYIEGGMDNFQDIYILRKTHR
ncbi:MAG: class I SAM-dependent methyltransferase [Planctomycetota bacterium]